MRLQQKVALITGGNGGIGRSIAEQAVAEGARVVITARDTVRGEETVQALRQAGGQALFVAADLSQADQVQQVIAQTIAEFGALHVVVNNAGAGAQKSGVTPPRRCGGALGKIDRPQLHRHLSRLGLCAPRTT